MTLSDLASLGSFVSSVAVVASLAYLGIQTHQNSKHTRALISQGRADHALRQHELMADNPGLMEVIVRGMAGDESLDVVQGSRFHAYSVNSFLTNEDEFRQHHAGLIEDARHAGFVKRIRNMLRQPGYRAMWQMQREGFDGDFQFFMDSLAREARQMPTPDYGAIWKSVVASERATSATRA